MDAGEMMEVESNEGGYLRVAGIPEEVFTPAAKVFGIDLLRDTIFRHAIYQGSGSLDRSTACSLRAIAKTWNDSVSKILHENGEPLFEVGLGHWNYLNSVPRPPETTTEFLDQITQSFVCSSRMFGRFPTYQLTLGTEAFRQENYDSLYFFLFCCGPGLVKIELHFPMDAGSMTGRFPYLSLPSLRKAVIGFDNDSMESSNQSESITYLLQSMFRGAGALKELEMFHFYDDPHNSELVESLVLPPTPPRMVLLKGISSSILETVLLKKPLPILTSLYLQTCEYSMGTGLFTRILENFRGSLKNLSLYGSSVDTREQNTASFRFLVMEKLETFETFSKRCQLEPGTRSLERYLPKLRRLRFSHQTLDMVGRWTDGSRLASVAELILDSGDGQLNFDPESMSGIHLAFPNVTELELTFVETPVAGLQYIFAQMTNLVELKIMTLGPARKQVEIDWDSLLTGIPAGLTAGLRVTPGFWESVQLNNDEEPSIRNLTELSTLSLQDGTYGPPSDPFITDLTFHFALLRMPQLKNFHFSRNFSVSPGMAEKWKAAGRFLKYTD